MTELSINTNEIKMNNEDLELKSVKQVYNQIAAHFDSTRHYRWKWITNFVSSIPIHSTIYDVGCGNGRNMLYPNYNFIGIDNYESFIDICLDKGLNVKLGEMDNLPFKNESCDAIINIAAFHHLASPERRIITLLEMKRVLKKGVKSCYQYGLKINLLKQEECLIITVLI